VNQGQGAGQSTLTAISEQKEVKGWMDSLFQGFFSLRFFFAAFRSKDRQEEPENSATDSRRQTRERRQR
jgi:hypothetical protein